MLLFCYSELIINCFYKPLNSFRFIVQRIQIMILNIENLQKAFNKKKANIE